MNLIFEKLLCYLKLATRSMDTGHYPMLSQPEELTRLRLVQILPFLSILRENRERGREPPRHTLRSLALPLSRREREQ